MAFADKAWGGAGTIYLTERSTMAKWDVSLGRPVRTYTTQYHELSHSYMGNENLNIFTTLYLYNRVLNRSLDIADWDLTGYTLNTNIQMPFRGMNALFEIYRLIGLDCMEKAFQKVRTLNPPNKDADGNYAALPDNCKKAFIEEVPQEYKHRVASLLDSIRVTPRVTPSREYYEINSPATGMCSDGEHLWVIHYPTSNITKLRLNDGNLVGTYNVGENPVAACFAEPYIWVVNIGSNNLTKINVGDGSIAGSYSIKDPWDICFDGAYIWVGCSSGLVKIKPSDSTITWVQNNITITSLVSDGTFVWALNQPSNKLYQINALDGAITKTYSTGNSPSSICYDGVCVWVTILGSDVVTKLDPTDGTSIQFNVGKSPKSVCYDGNNIWVISYDINAITKLKAIDGSLIENLYFENMPEEIYFDGTNIWLAIAARGITKIKVS